VDRTISALYDELERRVDTLDQTDLTLIRRGILLASIEEISRYRKVVQDKKGLGGLREGR
jgi:hypothetical protein